MDRLFLSILLLLPFCALADADKVVASASYKNICKKMAQAGVTSRTQTNQAQKLISDNMLVIVGADSVAESGQRRDVSNSKIIVGTNMTSISTYTSGANTASSFSADPCESVIELERPQIPEPASISSPSILGQ